MRLEIDIPEHHYNNIMALDSVNIGRVPYKGIIMYAINAIKHGKALEQEPRKGHWIDREVYDADRWKCSECGRTEQWKENFCPNCGAKMEKRIEEEEV